MTDLAGPSVPAAPGRTRPTGRDEIRMAVIDAAAGLFAERGPAEVTTREIAERAGVNRGLLHRHFGGKDELVAEVLADGIADFARRLGEGSPDDVASLVRAAFDAADESASTTRLLVRMLLDGVTIDAAGLREGLVDAFVAAVEGDARTTGGTDPRMAAAIIVGALIGWQLFAPTLLEAVGLVRDPPAAREELAALATTLAQRARPTSSVA